MILIKSIIKDLIKAWCEDMINFTKIFKWENVKKEVPHRWELTLRLTFHVIKRASVSLGNHPKVSPFLFLLLYCLREELRENISFSSRREKVSFSFKFLRVLVFSYFQERGCHCFLLGTRENGYVIFPFFE